MPDSTFTVVKPSSENTPTAALKKDKWTLMFLIMGDASLSASMISQLKELKDAGFQEDTNVLLYFDPNCNGKGARIYDVNHDRKEKSVTSKTVIGDGPNPFVRNIAEDCSIQSMQQIRSALSLRYFLTYSRTYYPANNYMLFLMGHGVIVGNDEFLPDPDDSSSITLKELGKILRDFGSKVRATEGDEFHLVGFHSCGMSSVELAFELEDSARYMMGTQGSAFPGSWPYRQILKKIFNSMGEFTGEQALNTGNGPNELVKEILTGLQNLSFYNARDFSDAGFSADLSICSLDKGELKKLKAALQNLVGELKIGVTNGAKDSILLAHLDSQSYFGESYSDLYDFCDRLQKRCPEGGSQDGIGKACTAVKRLLVSERCDDKKTDPDGQFKQLVVFSDYYGPAYQHSNGLSIFFPWKAPVEKVMANYDKYKFTEELGSDSWMSFLKDYFFRTKRPMNGHPLKEESDEKTATKARAQLKVAPVNPPEEEVSPSDAEILRLGPMPRQKPAAVIARIALLQKEIGTLAESVEKETATLASDKETATLVKEMASLAEKIATLEKETGTLAKETATLAEKRATLAKEMATLAGSGKETATLSKEMASLAKEMASLAATGIETIATKLTSLEKETATLAGSGKETATLAGSGKETATLAKEMASLAKETATLAKETATLASNKETATLAKETATLAKETATLGFFGATIIKNFDAPEDRPITSRPKGRPNRGVKEENEWDVAAKTRLRATRSKSVRSTRMPKTKPGSAELRLARSAGK